MDQRQRRTAQTRAAHSGNENDLQRRSTQRRSSAAQTRGTNGRVTNSSQSRTSQAGRTAKKKKRQKVRFHNKNLKRQLLTLITIVMAVVLCLVVFFRINHINIYNAGSQTQQPSADEKRHVYYTAQEVEAASGIEKGDNLLTLSKDAVAAKIIAELPYVSQVHIDRVLPGTVEITITEFDVTYAIEDTAGGWWLINRDGKVLEATDASEAKTHLQIKGLRIESPSISKQIEPEQSEQMEEQNAKKTSLISLLQLVEAYEYCKQLVSIDVTVSYDIRLWYGTQFEIRIGNTEELAYKLAYLDGVLKELKSYQSGVIDLSFTEDKTARFQPFSE